MALWPVSGSAVLARGGNSICLGPASAYLLGPGASVYTIELDSLGYLALQQRDPITTQWTGVAWPSVSAAQLVYSDGQNYRIANVTGSPQSIASITPGSGYTSAPSVTPDAGNSLWQALIGGKVNSSVSIINGGTGYTFPPIVLIEAPPQPGVQATAYATLTNGAVTAVTLEIAGAGYVEPPQITFLNDPRELSPINPAITTGYGAAAVASLTGAGTVTGVVLFDQGDQVGSTPNLVFSGGGGSSGAATISAIVAAAPATAYIQQM